MTSTFPTTAPSTEASPTTEPAPRLWRVGVVAGAAAAAATTLVALAADAVGVSLAVGGEQIPAAGFAQLTFVFALVGLALAAVLARRARNPRTTFVRTTLVLTAISLVPDVVADADMATRLTLGLTHVVAAAIVIPALARRLSAR